MGDSDETENVEAPAVDAEASADAVNPDSGSGAVEGSSASPTDPDVVEVESLESEESTAEVEGAESGVVADDAAEADDESDGGDEEELVVTNSGPLEEITEDDDDINMDWYILKVQSNRENTICDALRRRVKVEGLERYFAEIMVPTEDIAEFKNGKKKIVKRKLYPGYIVAHMTINDDTWFLVRETPGIGDFTGSQGKPSPMLKHEVDRIVKSANPDEEDGEQQVKTAIPFKLGDRVRIKEGTFENFEGDVEGIDEANGRVTVTISIFGRSTPFEAEHWQIEAI